jgi:hypothetical protein
LLPVLAEEPVEQNYIAGHVFNLTALVSYELFAEEIRRPSTSAAMVPISSVPNLTTSWYLRSIDVAAASCAIISRQRRRPRSPQGQLRMLVRTHGTSLKRSRLALTARSTTFPELVAQAFRWESMGVVPFNCIFSC